MLGLEILKRGVIGDRVTATAAELADVDPKTFVTCKEIRNEVPGDKNRMGMITVVDVFGYLLFR